MKVNDFPIQINQFMTHRSSNVHRYASWDFCYEYFYHNQVN